MNQWEIYLYRFNTEGPHPAVILSNQERCENPDIVYVNVLICTSAKLNRGPKKNEVILDENDGLDWKTAVRCDLLYLLPKNEFSQKRGSVTPRRRTEISKKIVETFRLLTASH